MHHQPLPKLFPYAVIAILLLSPGLASAQSTPIGLQDLAPNISSLSVADDQSLASFGSFIVRLLGNIHLFGIVNFGSIRTASTADTTPPSTPTNLTAVASSSSELDLSWTASTDNVGVAGYKVFRAGSQVGTSTQTTYADVGLSASTTYTYTVKAFDAAGNVSVASNIATSTTGTWADGFAGAASGTPQFPHLLDLQTVTSVGVQPGSGYTNGTGYVWTSSGGGCATNASGTVDVVGGVLTNQIISSGGSGCTSLPTIAIPAGAGSGTGGAMYPMVYQVRPPWRVAGVDYAVGTNSGATFVAPSSGNIPSCTSLGTNVINVNTVPCTISGFDLSNYTVFINASLGGMVTVTGNTSSSNVNIRSGVSCTSTLNVTYNVLDGGGTASNPNFQLIQTWCPTVAIEYNWITQSNAGIGCEGNACTIKYNMIDRTDYAPPNHANAIYLSGSNPSANVSFNTAWSGGVYTGSVLVGGYPVYIPIGLGAAFAEFTDWGSSTNISYNNNTMISALPGSVSYFLYWDSYNKYQGFTVTGSASSNYFASLNGFNGTNSGAFGAYYTDSGATATTSGGVDMATGGSL